MSTKTVKVEFRNDSMAIPAWDTPPAEPLQDVSKIVYNGITTNGNEDMRVFVPERKCKRVWYEPTRVHICSLCGCGMPKALYKYCFLHYCPNCGARIEDE